jgi:hypothetical protein
VRPVHVAGCLHSRLRPACCCRCRWLRSLMLRNGLYHRSMRSLQPSKLGALLLHLPAVWPRLEYLMQVRWLGGRGVTL